MSKDEGRNEPMCEAEEKCVRLYDIMRDGSLTDMIVQAGYFQTRAHSSVLAASSEVLRNQIESLTKLHSSPLEIFIKLPDPSDDIDEDSLKKFLCYIYTAKIDDWGHSVATLLKLAHAYKMERLMVLCDHRLLEFLSANNAIDCLYLAGKYDRVALMKNIATYITTHMENIVVSKNWRKLEDDLDLLGSVIFANLPNINKGRVNERRREISNTVTWEINLEEGKFEMASILTAQIDREVSIDVQVELGVSDKLEVPCLEFRAGSVNISDLRERFLLTIALVLKTTDHVHSEKIFYIRWPPNDFSTKCIEVIHNLSYLGIPKAFSLTVTIKANEHLHSKYTQPFLRFVREETRFTDTKILVGKNTYPVHKIVLASHSMYFSQLFDDFWQCKEYRLDDKIVSSAAFDTLKLYMYKGSLPHQTDVDVFLLKAAHHLKMHHVVQFCSYVLMNKLSVENVVEICIASEILNLNDLKIATVDFIAQNFGMVVGKWMPLREHPNLVKAVVLRVCVGN